MKRLHDVVVGPCAKPVYFVLPAVARRQNQYRIGLALLPELTDDIEPGDFRQPKIDDREVDRVLERKVESSLPSAACSTPKPASASWLQSVSRRVASSSITSKRMGIVL